MPGNWSRLEVEAVVADYIAMLKEELQHREYNKTQHRRLVASMLPDRSDGSIERKHQNISAILIGLGHPWITGYKPLGNFQGLLAEVVSDRLSFDGELAALAEQAVRAPGTTPQIDRILSRLEDPPEPAQLKYPALKERFIIPGQTRTRINYLEVEANNGSLGRAGEEFIVRFERERLQQLGKESLADRIEHIAVTEGDGAGFDIRSFEPDGTDRFIEVKTTAYGKQTPFLVSRNEVAVSNYRGLRYHLCRLFKFRDDPRFYSLDGSIQDRCLLEPTQFVARPRLAT
ncbi:MAG: DUF3883 domain-containing protein [Gemmatimonadaceae bacterium]|nr:DUF3883 domain-containing protein [Gemmatimonadaceae bacterium]